MTNGLLGKCEPKILRYVSKHNGTHNGQKNKLCIYIYIYLRGSDNGYVHVSFGKFRYVVMMLHYSIPIINNFCKTTMFKLI